MTIRGSCLCGAIRFEFAKAVGPFEICHCNRCRKRSGANGLAMIGVHSDDFVYLSGVEQIGCYAAPILKKPPAYHAHFCKRCGATTPPPVPEGWFEVPAGLLDDDPEIRPDKHIYVELAAAWEELADGLPKYTASEIASLRRDELKG